MDETDRKIIQVLRKDARTPFIHVARRVGLSEAAVRRRVKNLVASGIIRGFTVEAELGGAARAIVLVSVTPSVATSHASEKLRMITAVETVYEVTGQYDIAVVMSGPNVAEINKGIEDIRRTRGVSNTNTMVVLRTFR